MGDGTVHSPNAAFDRISGAGAAPSTHEPAVGVPTAAAFGPDRVKVYGPRSSKQWRLGLMGIGLGLLGLFPLMSVLNGLNGGPTPDHGTTIAAFCLLFVPFGIYSIVNALRGLPRLTVTPEGLELRGGLRARFASWNTLEPFELRAIRTGGSGKQVLTGTATIIDPNASKASLLRRRFSIPDVFLTPIGTILDELNAVRAAAVGTAESLLAPAMAPNELPVGVAGFRLPWLTLALLAVLIAIFAAENLLSTTPGGTLSPSVGTLLAMGGLSRTAVLSNTEWYRLFTAPLLHGGFIHILSNGVALLLGGALLERLIGRSWFFAIFFIGALGGSLMSLAVGPDNIVSVGASGALMGMFAALLVGGFRLPPGTAARHKLQTNSLQVLIPSLLPLASATSIGHIDYGAHFGGALSGALAAAVLLKFWPATQRIPQLWTVAAGVSIVGALLFVISAAIAVGNFSKYSVKLIPPAEMPTNAAEGETRAAALVARYPGDPRSHLYLGLALDATKDVAGAERKLRAALASAQALSAMFEPQLELNVRGVLAAFLMDQGRANEAKEVAHSVCAAPAGEKGIESMLKILVDQHLCD